MNKRLGSLVLALAAATLFTAPVLAQDYPNRPVKIILGFPPGGGIDTMARVLAGKLSESFGQQFIVENKTGAGGTVAAAFVANAAPDGYTLLLGETSQLEIAPNTQKSLPYDPEKDLTPVGLVTTSALVLVANPKTQIKSLPDLLQAAKANPGKLTYGSSGMGSIHHLAGAVFEKMAGLELTHVPYKGSGQSIQAVLSGEVDLCMTSMTAAQTLIAADRLTLLATTSQKPLPSHPDTPSLSTVVKGFNYSVENGLLAPPGLPPAVLARLADAVKNAVESPELLRLAQGAPGTVTSWMSPAQYKENITTNRKKFADAVKLIGLTPE